MKTRQILLISRSALLMLSLLSFLTFSSPGQTDYFYSFDGEKITLDIIPGRVVIKPVESLSIEQVTQSLHASFGPVSARSITGLLSDGFIEIELERLEKDKVQTLETINTMRLDPELFIVNPVYEIDGNPLIAYDVFVIYIENETDLSELERLNQQYNVELIDRDIFLPNIISLRMLSYDEKSVTEMARLYYENLSLSWSVPDFKREIIRHSQISDPYYPYQFYLNMTSTPLSWDITKGVQDIVVAVIDDGVMVHEDLPSSRLVEGFDAFDETDGAPGGNEAHGMAVAGIIAASHNDKGIAGIAPNVKIMPVRIFDEKGNETTDLLLRTAFSYAVNNGADVINNSWTYNTSSDANPQLTTIIQDAMQNGRDGKGTVIIFSAGNNGGSIRYPANISGVIAVGAIDQNNTVFNYSARGPQLNLVAPSGLTGELLAVIPCGVGNRYRYRFHGDVWSLDHNGQSGWNPGNYKISAPDCYNEYVWDTHAGQPTPTERYTSHFGGTSASAPQISGAVALMLSVNPNLTVNQVRNFIHYTAVNLPGMNGNSYTEEYGYGRLNTYLAVRQAFAPFNLNIVNFDQNGWPPLLEWNYYQIPDFSHFNVYRKIHDIMFSEYELIATTTQTNYMDYEVIIDSGSSVQISYIIKAVLNNDAESAPSNTKAINGMTMMDYDEDKEILDREVVNLIPKEFKVSPNYPNPFNPSTTIDFEVPELSHVTIIIYDILGREIISLVDALTDHGYHTTVWDGRDSNGNPVSSGMYVYKFTAVPSNKNSGQTTISKVHTMTVIK